MADRESRFLGYVQHLAAALGHADRAGPLQACWGHSMERGLGQFW